MRQAAGIFRNAAIVGETRDRLYVRERRPAQPQPFGLEEAATRLAQCRSRDILQHVGLLSAKTKRNFGTGRVFWFAEHTQKKRRPVSRLPFGALKSSAGSTGPGGLILSTVYSAAVSVIGTTDTKVRPLAFARNSTWPSTLANRVWSVPMPTLRPGCQVVPRWRAMMWPGLTCSPP